LRTVSVHWVKNRYKDRWFADPFILRVTQSEIFVLAEEFFFPIKRARLTLLVIDREKFEIKKNDTVLELGTHLSFPNIYRKGESTYIYPENSGGGKSVLYKYDEGTNGIMPVAILAEEPLADPALVEISGNNYLFATKLPAPSANTLYIYTAKNWDGPYELFQTVQFNNNIARNAGNLFIHNNMLIRPCQDCNEDYGKGLVFQKVNSTNGIFSFQELCRYYPPAGYWNAGMHTFNIYNNIIAVDGKHYTFPLLKKIRIFLNRI
jgi:hypothetical protein